MIPLTNKLRVLVCALTLFAGTTQAATVGLTLNSNIDPFNVIGGDSITFTVGMTSPTPITGYTLDIRYDMSELSFVSSSQSLPFFGGFKPPFTLNPSTTAGDLDSTGLATSGSGRASLLFPNNSDPIGDLFSLTFNVLNPITDNLDDLTIGILNTAADAINPAFGAAPITLTSNTVSAQISSVPVPAALWLFGSGLMGLVSMARKQKQILI